MKETLQSAVSWSWLQIRISCVGETLRIPLNITWIVRHLPSITAQIRGPPLLHMDSFNEYTGFLRVFFSPDLMLYHPLFTKGVVSSFVMW